MANLPAVRIVLVHARNALNMGAAARAMANFGLSDLAVVAPYGEAWRTARSARAGAEVLRSARACATLPEALADCTTVIGTTAGTDRRPALPLEDWRAVAASLPPATPAAPIALLFGSEKFGLSVDDLSYCHRLARLPTLPGAPSMNLGQAVAVCVYELARGPEPAGLPTAAAAPPAGGELTGDERERLVETWQPLLERLGVSSPQHRPSQSRRLRRMLLRWRLGREDAQRLLGIARQTRHALDGVPGGEPDAGVSPPD